MPVAHVGDVERWLEDNDSDVVTETPPIQNTWYELFDEEDIRLIWCEIEQSNDESAIKNIEVRWTIDGNVYLISVPAAHGSAYTIYRFFMPSAVGTAGLMYDTAYRNAGYSVDKRGLAFKVEVRMTSVPGTNQVMTCRTVKEEQAIT